MNRRVLLKIIRTIKFLARQGLPLRGVGADADSNLVQLLKLQSRDCPELCTWLQKKTNKCTSPDIQNEIMSIMAMQILRKVCEEIRENGPYTIMADECTDVANTERFTLCIRSVGEDMSCCEFFIGLYQIAKIDSNSLVHAIKDTLLRMNIEISKCRGQCYDGASNMGGSRNGVAVQIAKEEKRALYIHCFAHALNLAVADTIRASKVCKDALDTVMEITKLIKFFPKRNAAFDAIKTADDHGIDSGLRSFCPTIDGPFEEKQ